MLRIPGPIGAGTARTGSHASPAAGPAGSFAPAGPLGGAADGGRAARGAGAAGSVGAGAGASSSPSSAPAGPAAGTTTDPRIAAEAKRRPVLQHASQGQAVRDLQKWLNELMQPTPGLAVDGAFGPKTKRAVLDYQKALELVVDGIVGPQTWTALLERRIARLRAPGSGPAAPAPAPPAPRPPPAPPPANEPRFPIAIRLRPVPYQRAKPPGWPPDAPALYGGLPYVAKLTDGARRGSLGADGAVRFEGLPGGNCEFRFQEFYEPIVRALRRPGS